MTVQSPASFRGLLRVFVIRWTCLVGLLCLFGCGDDGPPPPTISAPKAITEVADRITPVAKVPRNHDYVGSAICADCHSEISRTYALTTMANSAAPISRTAEIETFADQWTVMSRMFRAQARKSEQGVEHCEQLLSFSDEVLCEDAEAIAYEIGSGKRGRSYLIERDDQLMLSPLTWYSTAARWDLSPGYAKTNRHFERTIVKACVQCHVGQIAPHSQALPDRFAKPAFTEFGIGCERCHGPGAQHVQFHQVKDKLGSTGHPDPIVNPIDLAPHVRDSVCNDCHQLGVERVLRFGMQPEDFRPGDPLSSVWVVFEKGDAATTEAGMTDAVNQVGQMESSKCFQQSAGRMGCISCHDPHSLPAPEKRVQFFRDRCLTCHTDPDAGCAVEVSVRLQKTAEDSCIECHMPALPAADVQHTSQTDHRVLRNPAAVPEVAASESLRLAANMKDIPEWEVQRARGILMGQYAADLKDPTLAIQACDQLEKLTARGLNDATVEKILGDCYLLQNRLEVAEQRWTQSLALDPGNEPALRSMAIAMHDAGRDVDAERLLAQYIQNNQWDRPILGRHIHVLARMGRQAEALKEAEAAVEKYPFDSLIRDWLAKAYEAMGRKNESETQRRIAERLSGKK